MTFDFRRAALALVVALSFVAPMAAMSASAPAPKIVSVDVTGNVHVPTQAIMQVLQAKPGMPYDPALVQADLQHLNDSGYFADVAAPLVRPRPNGVAITYRVIENPVLTKITFTGNNKVPTDTLLALMDLSIGQVFNSNTFRQDVLKINNYYERIGYSGQVPTHVIDVNFDTKAGSLALTIREGLTVRNIIIGGDPVIPGPIVAKQLAIKPGMVYSDEYRSRLDPEALRKWYEDKFKVELGNFEGGIDPTSIDEKAGTADVKYNVYVARVAVVQITGNTRTKDQVIRRELRVRPGMVVNTDLIRADYERLNSTNYFSKINPDIKEGPDPKKPQDVTLVWQVTEQRTATAQVGFGYSGGITGQGLYGTLGYQDSNLHGTGNSANVQFQRGSRTSLAQVSTTIPYVGSTKQSQRYSLGVSLSSSSQTYYYPVYSVTSNIIQQSPTVGATSPPIPVTLSPSGNSSLISGIVSTSTSDQIGGSVQVSRRLSDYVVVTVAPQISRVRYSTTVPNGYFFQGSQPNVLTGPTPNPLNSNVNNNNGTFGIGASSIANVNTGLPYALNTLTFGISTSPITVDDPTNPRRGWNASISELISSTGILRSSFNFTETSIAVSRFFPVLKTATFGVHIAPEFTTGVLPPSQLVTFSDQQIRGYNTVFYGTDSVLGQAEFRQPLTADRKLTAVLFVDGLKYRIRGAYPLRDPYTNRITGYPGDWSTVGDMGLGLRFDVPQLGLRTVRLDFARGVNGTHMSFGIGQAF